MEILLQAGMDPNSFDTDTGMYIIIINMASSINLHVLIVFEYHPPRIQRICGVCMYLQLCFYLFLNSDNRYDAIT